MKPDADAHIVPLVKKAHIVGDDLYLTEINKFLRKLRELVGEQETRKGALSVGLAGSRPHQNSSFLVPATSCDRHNNKNFYILD